MLAVVLERLRRLEARQVDQLRHLSNGGAVRDEVAAAADPQHDLRRPVEVLLNRDLLSAVAVRGDHRIHDGKPTALTPSRRRGPLL